MKVRSRRAGQVLATLLLAALALSACSGDLESSSDDATSDAGDSFGGGGGWLDGEAERVWEGSDEAGLYAGGEADAAAPAPPTSAASGLPTTAGSVDDNELWDDYLLYRQAFERLGLPVSDVPVEGRQILSVVDGEGDPVVGADVEVLSASGEPVAHLRTYADGRALFHPAIEVDPDDQSRPDFRVRVSKGGFAVEDDLPAGELEHTIELDGATNSGVKLDVHFLIDTTGSMSDEIERLKANVTSISESVRELPGAPDARFGMTVYRDRGDVFVTRTFDFTPDVGAFSAALDEVVADGGGDTPESLNAGLHEALTVPSWRTDDTVKLVFLVADAPPHLAGEPGYEDEPDYAADIVEAAARGIKVFPIASSGLDDQGEFIFRQLAQITLGRFVFLTYGTDGSPGGETTPHSVAPEDYDVLALDELVVQLIGDEIAPLAS
jgi:hypothetical protein